MTANSNERSDQREKLQEILAEYLELSESGSEPDHESLLARYPEFADQLAAFLDDRDSIEKFVAPIRDKKKTAVEIEPTIGTEEAAPPEPGEVVRYFGDYELLEEIARGGMGVVYKARQVSLNRIVALKMILTGQLASEQDVQRFHTEAEAAANLDHPNIVPIYEVGEHEGLHYFSMGFVDGHSLAERLAEGPLPASEAAELTKTLADSVAYAHEQGVIHRDLKPANVLIDSRGEPRITDFGLARREDDDSGMTATGQILGTPSYMPPEQALGKNEEIGPNVDVYALGATLYALLTGRPPFQGVNIVETLKQLQVQEPVSPRQLNAAIPVDLETICLKCLNKGVESRYVSATEVSEELGRLLSGHPIHARPTGKVERCWRWARRHPATAALLVVSTLAAMACIGVGVAVVYQQRLESANDQLASSNTKLSSTNLQLERAKQNLESSLQRQTELTGQLRESLSETDAARRAEEKAKDELDQVLYFRRVSLAHSAWRDNDVPRAKLLLRECPPSQRNIEWHYVDRLCNSELLTLTAHNDGVFHVGFNSDGRLLTTAGKESVKVWDAQEGQEVLGLKFDRVFGVHRAGRNRIAIQRQNSIEFWNIDNRTKNHTLAVSDGRTLGISKNGNFIVTAEPVEVWDAEDARKLQSFRVEDQVVGIDISSDGRWLVLVTFDGQHQYSVHLRQPSGDRTAINLRGPRDKNWRSPDVDLSPDGKRVAIAIATDSHDRWVEVWDIEGEHKSFTLEHITNFVRFSPDGKLIATSGGRQVNIWDADTGRQRFTLPTGAVDWPPTAVVFSDDSKRIATAKARDLQVWDVSNGREVANLRGHSLDINAVALDSSGRRIASSSFDGTIKVWDVDRNQESRILKVDHAMSLAYDPVGKRLASANYDQTVTVWDTSTGNRIHTFEGHTVPVFGVAFSPDGQRIISGGGRRSRVELKLWDSRTGNEISSLVGHEDAVTGVAFSPDGSRIASASNECVKIWNAESGRELVTIQQRNPRLVVFSPDGNRIVSGKHDYQNPNAPVWIWDARTGKEVLSLEGCGPNISCIDFSPDGRFIVGGGGGTDEHALGRLLLWDSQTGKKIRSFEVHTKLIYSVAFSRDGKRIAAGSHDGTGIWDVESGHQALLLGRASQAQRVVFSPDGKQLATAAGAQEVRLWDFSNSR